MRTEKIAGRIKIAIIRAFCSEVGKIGFYNTQEVGLAKALENIGYDVVIILPDKSQGKIETTLVSDYVKIVYAPCFTLGSHAIFNLNILLEYGIQVVHYGCDNSPFAPIVMRFCKKHGIMIYNYLGILYSKNDSRAMRIIMDIICSGTRKAFKFYPTVAKTPDVKNQLEKLGINHIQVMPVGLDLSIIPDVTESKEELRKQYKIPTDKKVILYIGRLDKRKRPLETLDLLYRLSDEFIMVFIGKGKLQAEVLEKVQVMKLEKRFIYISELPNAEIHNLYKASDFFVNMALSEIFGMSIMEAMYQKCIVVARNSPGPNYIIEHKKTGYIALSDEEIIEFIYNHSDAEMGERARERILSSFSWDATAQKLDRMIRELIHE